MPMDFRHYINAVFRAMAIAALLAAGSLPALADVPAANDTRGAHVNTGLRMGDDTVEGFVDFLVPLAERGNSLFMINPRASLRDEGESEINLGLVWRHLLPDAGISVGANAWFDTRESRHDNRFNQTGFGLEILGRRVDARVNWYNADNDLEPFNEFTTRETAVRTDVSVRADVVTRRRVAVDVASNVKTTVTETTEWDAPYAEGHEVLQDFERDITTTSVTERVTTRATTDTRTVRTTRTTQRTTTITDRLFRQFESGLDGFDAEIGVKLPLPESAPELRVFAGYYDFDNPFGDDIEGYKGRLELRAGPYLTFDAEFFDDDRLNGTDYFVGLRLQVPLYGDNTWKRVRDGLRASAHRPVAERRYTDMVMRDVRVQTAESDPLEDVARRRQTTDVEVEKQVSERSDSRTTATRSTEVVDSDSHTDTESGTETIRDDVTFVDADNNSGTEDGTVENPYNELQEGADEGTVAGNNTIFLCESGGGVCDLAGGAGSYDETVILHDQQVLTSSIAANGGLFFETANRPLIAPGADGGNSAVITLDNATTTVSVHRIRIDATSVSGLAGIGTSIGSQVGDVSLTNNVIGTSEIVANGIEVRSDATGTTTIGGNTIDSVGSGDGIFVDRDGDSSITTIHDNVIRTDGLNGFGIRVEGNADNLFYTITDNSVTTVGDNSDGIVFDVGTNIFVNARGVIGGNTVVTEGDNSEGIITDVGTEGGMVEILDNTVTTGGEDAVGIMTADDVENGVTRIVGNRIDTTGLRADGIESRNEGAGHLTEIIDNVITTAGQSADGIESGNSDADTGDRITVRIIGNDITTTGSGSDGIEADDDGIELQVIDGNIIRTQGADSLGMDVRSDDSVAGDVVIIVNNDVMTLNDGAHGIVATSGNTGTDYSISGNLVDTSGNDAIGIFGDRSGVGSTTSIDRNTVTTAGIDSPAVELDSSVCNTVTGNDLTATNSDEILVGAGTPIGNRTTLAADNELNSGTVVDNGSADCP